MSALLEVSRLEKCFGPVVALHDLSFSLDAGEVHALCGENGAGKSTLIKVLSGVHAFGSYQGTITLDGKSAHFASPRAAERAGIAVIHQELSLFDGLSVAENLCLPELSTRFGVVRWPEVMRRARAALATCQVELDPEATLSSLSVGQKQLVEIARAVAKRPRVLILDEPTAALAEHEVANVLRVVKGLRAQGIACLYVSHKLEEVFALADRITVLRDGQSVLTRSATELSRDELVQHMVGRQVSTLFPARAAQTGAVVLTVEELTVSTESRSVPRLEGLHFQVARGEVLGIGGLLGAGRSELLLHLVGAYGRRIAGKVQLEGEPLSAAHPREAQARGMVLVAEDRRRQGVFAEASVAFNASISSLGLAERALTIAPAREQARVRDKLDELRTKRASLDVEVSTLSGGNQQKVLLARALLSQPKVLLLDEPSVCFVVGAKAELYQFLARLVEQGMAVVLVSSELEELLGLSDRIVMLCDGRIGGSFTRAEATPERLMAAALGHHTSESEAS